MKAGPTLLQGSNLGGLDITGTMWLTKRWGLQTSERAYLGTSGAGINAANRGGGPIKGPFVAEYFFTGGPEWLGPHNQHGAILAHLLVGGVYGQFEQQPARPVALGRRISTTTSSRRPPSSAGTSTSTDPRTGFSASRLTRS